MPGPAHAYLAKATALLSTSHYEGFSNTFLEALYTGTPVIAPRRVDPDLIITRNYLGLTSEDEKELPILIKEITTMDNAEYQELSNRCRQYVIQHHDPKSKAFQLITLLAPLLKT